MNAGDLVMQAQARVARTQVAQKSYLSDWRQTIRRRDFATARQAWLTRFQIWPPQNMPQGAALSFERVAGRCAYPQRL
jgi:hypothetical protein